MTELIITAASNAINILATTRNIRLSFDNEAVFISHSIKPVISKLDIRQKGRLRQKMEPKKEDFSM
ncbi:MULTISPECIES: hypothetical protein [Alkalimonas]|uniref:Uncharacterized protein n=1 Tax=Alkalimonas mucilaginosa TaxID=3057676 RepID=A0ABU7JJR9_9GAMM|nr:hypothetical protein [Alkalimonas sp. MEB004]MEE2025345.1 hypothetical protein [Alkalimonas sp. MEB004]